jgi:hypothetical protein
VGAAGPLDDRQRDAVDVVEDVPRTSIFERK